jgi:hypothetical protein
MKAINTVSNRSQTGATINLALRIATTLIVQQRQNSEHPHRRDLRVTEISSW